jgi:very-short-patch-repair endonuclease
MANLGRTIDRWFYYGAFPETFRTAHKLRGSMTPAEKILWQELRNRNITGYKFRRQHPVREFIVDFFCPEKELVIEIDGKIHQLPDVNEKDKNRTAELERLGLTVIRFTNEEIVDDLTGVLKKIEKTLSSPSPPGEGAGG